MNLFKPKNVAYAHCDLPCGVYDPAQARINAESVVNASKKYQESDDPAFKQRCITIKEDMAEEVKKDLWVLWTDYFKPEWIEIDRILACRVDREIVNVRGKYGAFEETAEKERRKYF